MSDGRTREAQAVDKREPTPQGSRPVRRPLLGSVAASRLRGSLRCLDDLRASVFERTEQRQ